MLADVFENLRKMCLEIYELDPAKLLSVTGLAWQGVLEKTKVSLELVTDIDMLLMVEKSIIGGICHSIYQYAKANNKYMKDYDRNKRLVIYSTLKCTKFIWLVNVEKASSK